MTQFMSQPIGLKKRHAPLTFKTASAAWLEMKQPTVAPKTHRIDKTHLAHILPVLGPKLISDIEPDDISRYQQHRLREKAAPKTVNLEVGTIRAILRRHRLWANVQPDVRMLSVREDVGKAHIGQVALRQAVAVLDRVARTRRRNRGPAKGRKKIVARIPLKSRQVENRRH